MVVADQTPTIGGQGSDGTVECPATASFTSPTASDTCGTSSVVLDSDTSTAGCENTYTETRTWHAVDACGNTSGRVHQTIMVVDDQPPTIGGQGNDGTVECPATPSFTSPTASDTCGKTGGALDRDTSNVGCGNT